MYFGVPICGAFCDTMAHCAIRSRIMAHAALPFSVVRGCPRAGGRKEEANMTTGLDAKPANVVDDAAPRKSRRGTETRRRTKHMTLRLLPQEQQVAEVVAAEFDMKSVQALIVEACQPLMSPGALAAIATDREALHALAQQHGISEVQALLLRALTSPTEPAVDPVAC
jgi:hypothetical protein